MRAARRQTSSTQRGAEAPQEHRCRISLSPHQEDGESEERGDEKHHDPIALGRESRRVSTVVMRLRGQTLRGCSARVTDLTVGVGTEGDGEDLVLHRPGRCSGVQTRQAQHEVERRQRDQQE